MATATFTHTIFQCTDTGLFRDNNEDRLAVSADQRLLAVADGMGGLEAGEVAAQIAVDSILEYFADLAKPTKHSAIPDSLLQSILFAHQNILQYSRQNPRIVNMGTTIVVAQINNKTVDIAWCGDSRAYLLRDKKLQQLTKDHSFVQSLVDAGVITKNEAFGHPKSHIISQHLGSIYQQPVPDNCRFDIQDHDLLLLCSDGLNSMVDDPAIERIMAAKKKPAKIVADLVAAAKEAGGNDNITVLLASFSKTNS